MQKRSRNNASLNRNTVVPFANFITVTSTATGTQTILSPSTLTSRLGVISDGFNNFRLLELKFRICLQTDGVAPGGFYVVAGYVGGADTTVPASIAACEYQHMVSWWDRYTVPSNWVEVPRAALAGPLPWYRSVPTAGVDTNEEYPGSIFYWSSFTKPILVEIRGVMEFKDPIDPLLSLSEKKELYRAKQRDRLLSLLANPTADIPSTSVARQGFKP